MDECYVKEVANAILIQLRTNTIELYAWGAADFRYCKRLHENTLFPALAFKIRTPKFRDGAKVIVTLNDGTDEYIIEIVTKAEGEEKIESIMKEVHWHQLHEIIKSLIEI